MSESGADDSTRKSTAGSDGGDESPTYFWGCTLTKTNPTAQWGTGTGGKFLLKQVVLGVDAIQGERNLVAAGCEGHGKKKLELPILSLSLGQQDMVTMSMDFHLPTAFRLIQGSGPVVITGEQQVGADAGDADGDEDDDEDEKEESAKGSSKPGGKAPHKSESGDKTGKKPKAKK